MCMKHDAATHQDITVFTFIIVRASKLKHKAQNSLHLEVWSSWRWKNSSFKQIPRTCTLKDGVFCCIPMTAAPDKCTGNQETTITLFPQMVCVMNPMTDMCWDSVVGTVTGYGLDSPGIESQWGWGVLHLSRPSLGSAEPPVQWVEGLLPRGKAAGVWRWPQLQFYCCSGTSWTVLWWTLPFTWLLDWWEWNIQQNKQAVVRQQ
jgi:hypothetical protein